MWCELIQICWLLLIWSVIQSATVFLVPFTKFVSKDAIEDRHTRLYSQSGCHSSIQQPSSGFSSSLVQPILPCVSLFYRIMCPVYLLQREMPYEYRGVNSLRGSTVILHALGSCAGPISCAGPQLKERLETIGPLSVIRCLLSASKTTNMTFIFD